MKRRKISIFCILLILVFAITGCSGGNKNENATNEKSKNEIITMKMVNLIPETDTIDIGMRYLEKLLEEKTKGKIQVEIYGNGSISSSNQEEAEMVQNNMVQMTTSPAYIMAGMNGNLKNWFLFDVPYLFENYDELWKFTDESDIYAKMRADLLAQTGINAYGLTPIGWCIVSSNKGPINSPADLKGQKIRTPSSDFYLGVISSFGANPTPIAWGETFTAMQQGAVDGMLTASNLYVSGRYYEVVKYIGAINPITIPHVPIVNNSWYESLPADIKPIFDECMADYIAYFRDLNSKANEAALDELEKNGCEVKRYSDEEYKAFAEAAKPLWVSKANVVGGADFIKGVQEWLAEYRKK